MISDFSRNLVIGHLINGFNANDYAFEAATDKVTLEFNFCLSRTKYPNGISTANKGNDPIVIIAQMIIKLPIPNIFRG
jgi:hypothetical protein